MGGNSPDRCDRYWGGGQYRLQQSRTRYLTEATGAGQNPDNVVALSLGTASLALPRQQPGSKPSPYPHRAHQPLRRLFQARDYKLPRSLRLGAGGDPLTWRPRSASIFDRRWLPPSSRKGPSQLREQAWQETTAETPSASQVGRIARLQHRDRVRHRQAIQRPRRKRAGRQAGAHPRRSRGSSPPGSASAARL
jgi:hypothetical protein